MTGSALKRADRIFSAIAVGVVISVLQLPIAARAVDVDIPRIQVNAERGSIKEQIELGAAYFTGRGVAQDEKRAAYWYEKAANAGDPGAQKQIGYFYQVGIGVPRDPAQAVKWYQRAVAGGLISAKVNLGVAYLWGKAVAKDPAMAEQLFREAFAQGNGLAACYLGDMYLLGIGVPRDEVAGRRWYEAGAKLHDPRSQFNLAISLSRHQDNLSDVKRAVKLWRESASAGLVAAKHQLGLLLVQKPELAASAHEATALLEEAASAGSWRSSVVLAVLFRDGREFPADPKAAYRYFRVGALQGGEEANRLVGNDLRILAEKLGKEQTAAIEAEATAWFGRHHLSLEFIYKDGETSKQFPVFAVANSEEDVHAGRPFGTDPQIP